MATKMKNWSLVPIIGGYELAIEVKRAFVCGGGLKHFIHVSIEVDGIVLFTTENRSSHLVWSDRFQLYF